MSFPGSEQVPQQVSSNRTLAPLALSAVVAAAGIVGAVVYYGKYSDERDTVSAQRTTLAERDRTIADLSETAAEREEIRKSACDYITAFTTYDYKDLDPFFTNARNGSTGPWGKQITDNEPLMRELMVDAELRSTSTGNRCGLETVDSDKASVIASVGQSVTNVDNAEPRTTRLAIVIAVEEQSDGRWLVSDMNAPGLLAPN